jgi:hypothetical protein
MLYGFEIDAYACRATIDDSTYGWSMTFAKGG